LPLEPLHAWRDFFIITATAAATLIGAMFVVVSIAVGILTRERSVATHAYLTSSLVHLGAVLAISLATMTPTLERLGLAAMLGAGGVAGVLYVATLAATIRRFRIDWTDQLWYTALPIVGYAGLAASAVLGLTANGHAVDLLAAATALILICGIRNAWDMILAFAMRPRPTGKD
jgi:hypothetical protein